MALTFDTSDLALDPEIEAFIRRRSAGVVPSAESAPPPPTAEPASRVPPAELRPTAMDPAPLPVPSRENEPSPMDQLVAAQDADRRTSERNALAQNLARSAALYRGDRVGGVSVPVPSEVRDFMDRRKMSGLAADPLTAAKLQLIRAQIAKTQTGDENETAPPEWGAPAGMSLGRAMRLGYGKAPRAKSPDDEPATKEQIEELLAKGYDAWGGMTVGEYKKAKDRVWGAEKNKEAAVAAAGRTVEVADKKEQNKRDLAKSEAADAMGVDWELGPKSPLASDDTMRRKFLESATSAREMRGLADELRGMIKRGLGPTSSAEDKTKAASIVSRLQLLQKQVDVLGVLSAVDISEFVNPQLKNPTSFDSMWKQWAGQYDPKAQLDQYIASMEKKIREQASAYDIRPTTSGAWSHLSGTPSNAGAEKPPRPGAIRTKSGKWAVKNAAGEWEYL